MSDYNLLWFCYYINWFIMFNHGLPFWSSYSIYTTFERHWNGGQEFRGVSHALLLTSFLVPLLCTMNIQTLYVCLNLRHRACAMANVYHLARFGFVVSSCWMCRTKVKGKWNGNKKRLTSICINTTPHTQIHFCVHTCLLIDACLLNAPNCLSVHRSINIDIDRYCSPLFVRYSTNIYWLNLSSSKTNLFLFHSFPFLNFFPIKLLLIYIAHQY